MQTAMLDSTIKRERIQSSIIKNWFQKPTSSDVLNFSIENNEERRQLFSRNSSKLFSFCSEIKLIWLCLSTKINSFAVRKEPGTDSKKKIN